MHQEIGPEDALALARDARARLAERAGSPPWYAPGYGLSCGGLVASLALPGWYGVFGAACSLLLATALYLVWSRRSGLSVNGYRRGRTLPVTAGLLVAFGIAFAVAFAWRDVPGHGWVPVAAGTVLAVVAAFASRAWDRAWRADMNDGI